MSISVRRHLARNLGNKAYRDAYVDANIRNDISFQIRAMRKDREWTQGELGERTEMAQETISKLEDPNYGRLTLKTLKRLASAFDVALIVRFAPFSSLVDWVTRLSPTDLAVPSFDDDHLLQASFPDRLSDGDTGVITVDKIETISHLPTHEGTNDQPWKQERRVDSYHIMQEVAAG